MASRRAKGAAANWLAGAGDATKLTLAAGEAALCGSLTSRALGQQCLVQEGY